VARVVVRAVPTPAVATADVARGGR
jgi:hypothetical protein